MDRRLDRAIRFVLEEARQKRKRPKEMDEILDRRASEASEKTTQLAAAQLVTEEKLQRLIDECPGGNGKSGT
jgi:hypothetical protein